MFQSLIEKIEGDYYLWINYYGASEIMVIFCLFPSIILLYANIFYNINTVIGILQNGIFAIDKNVSRKKFCGIDCRR